MPAAYDTYDYPSYWEGREYEHQSELIAVSKFLQKIPRIGKTLDIGSGFGRLVPSYFYRAERIILADPSAKILKLAREKFNSPKIRFIHSKLENLDKKIKKNSVDLILLVRVLHHLENPDLALEKIASFLRSNGYLILEFANKRHGKSLLLEFFRGNFTFIMDIFPKEVGVTKKTKKKKIPFKNYHPDVIKEILRKNGFKIIEIRSVSNIRSPFIKKILPLDLLVFFERNLQRLLAKFYFGPSIFILAKKIK